MSVKIDEKIIQCAVVNKNLKKRRPTFLSGNTYRLKTHVYRYAFYVTINHMDNKPYEIFINSQNVDAKMWMDSNTFSWSSMFAHNDNIDFLVDKMLKVVDPRGSHSAHGRFHSSIVAEIGYILQCERDNIPLEKSKQDKLIVENGEFIKEPCVECGGNVFRMKDGCPECKTCLNSKCG